MEILRLVFDLISVVLSLFLAIAFLFLYIRLGDNLFKIIKSIYYLYCAKSDLYIMKKNDVACEFALIRNKTPVIYVCCSSSMFEYEDMERLNDFIKEKQNGK